MVKMTTDSVRRYLQFFLARRSSYFQLNKQLLIAELAGLCAGTGVSEMASAGGVGQFGISVYSSAADYAASIASFLAIYYKDEKSQYGEAPRSMRLKKVLGSALRLWPSVIAADIVFILVRPYFQYLALSNGLEAGMAAIIAHFIAFGFFNLVAVFSKSIIDYAKHIKINTT
jgi:hypothetical protein